MRPTLDSVGSGDYFRRGDLSRRRRSPTEHHCELRKTSQSTLPRLPPNVQLVRRLKRSFQKLIIVSDHHPYTKRLLRSRAAMSAEKRRHGRSKTWWVVHPYSRLRFCWDNLMTVIFLYFFIAVPYVKAFFRVCGRDISNRFDFIYPAFGICVVDIFMSFLTGYVAEGDTVVCLDPRLIARYYCQRYFLLDLVTSFPYTWFASKDLTAPGPDANFLTFLLEILPILKIFRIPTLRRYIKQINTAFGYTSVADVVIWQCLLSTLIIHWSACLTWAYPFVVLYATRSDIREADAFVIKEGVYGRSPSYIYLISLHMGVSNLVGSNFIELMETSVADKTIRCALLLFGTGYMIYLIVVVLQLVESSAEPELKYQEMMSRVREYIKQNRLPQSLGDKLIKYYVYRFQGSYFKEYTIMNTLSSHLRMEVNVRTNRGLLETATILHNLSKTFLTSLLNAMTPVIYLEDDVIYKHGDDGDCMYFIVSGTVAVITSKNRELKHLVDGDYFGELAVLHVNRPRDVSTIAVEPCEFLQLKRRVFNRLILPDSEFYKRLTRNAERRVQEFEDSIKEFEDEEAAKNRQRVQVKKLLMRTTNIDSKPTSSSE